MKRCPQCNRVESDEALKFCRVDGATLISDSSAIGSEAGTVGLYPATNASEVHTSILPQNTSANVDRSTGPTTALPPQSTSGTTSELNTQRHRKTAIIVTVIVTAVVAATSAILVNSYRSKTSGAAIQSIAVMPFVNESGNAEIDYLSDGMTETLIRSLSQLPNLNVKSRSSVFRYKGRNTDARTIGKELGVQAVLSGRVIQRGDQLTLDLELTNAENENVIWTDQYLRKASDLISLQNDIARDVSNRLRLKLTLADQQKLAKNYTVDPEVYKLYLQGRFYWNKRTNSEVQKAESYFKQAVEKDPNFALGWVGLADSFEDQDRPRKKEYIRRALEIDDNLAEAHASLGYQYMCFYDWVASERELKRAQELNPNYPQAYAWNGARLMMLGRYDESLAEIQRGLKIDPTSNGINFYKAVCLAVSGRREESIQQFKRMQEMDPTFVWAHSFLSRVYVWTGNYPGAVEEHARAVELDGSPDNAKLLRDAFASGGWSAFLRESTRQGGGGFAQLARLSDGSDSDKEKVMKNLVEQTDRGFFWLFLIKTDPRFDQLRDDPRFKELLKKFDPPK
jgi:TolB-like protein/Tfp pilus assembly protein PilF